MSAIILVVTAIVSCRFAYRVWRRDAMAHRPRALLLRAPGCVAGGEHVRPWHKHDLCGAGCPWSPFEVRHAEAAWARDVPLPERPDRVRR